MPIPEKISETLAKNIFNLLNEKNLIVADESSGNLESILDDVIAKNLAEAKFEVEKTPPTDAPQNFLSKNMARLKEQLAEQKFLFRKAEIEKSKLINKGQIREDSLTDSFKKMLDEEKGTLINKLKSFEDENKKYAEQLQAVSEDKTKIPVLKEELKNIQGLLASEKQLQERLIAEKEFVEKELKIAQDELKYSTEGKEKSSLIKDSIEKIKNYKDENSKLQKQLSLLADKFRKEKKNAPPQESKVLEVEVSRLKDEIKELQKKLSVVEAEKEELLALQLEETIEAAEEKTVEAVEEGNIAQEITDEFKVQDEQSKNFKIINQLNDESFKLYKVLLNAQENYETRIKKLDVSINKTKEDIEQFTSENKDADSAENYSIQVLDYFSDQVVKKEALKKVMVEQRKLNAEAGTEDQPVIIQKKVIKKHSAHGGSWKVAYADFVTAMMAFFLMLWLLSMLSQEARDNLKEYFKSYKAFKHSGQELAKGKDSIRQTDAVRISNKKEKLLDQKRMIEEFKNRFKGADEHLKVIEVPGGIRIQVMDIMDQPMFEVGSAVFRPAAVEIFEFLAERIKNLPGTIIIEGHTDALPYSKGDKTNWELSMERASTARIHLMKNGVEGNRIKRIVAYGHAEPMNRDNLFDPRNRRINIILSNQEQENLEKESSEKKNTKEKSPENISH